MTVAQLYTISSATHKTERAFSNGVQTSNLKTHIDLNLKCVQNVEDSSGPAGPARVLEPATVFCLLCSKMKALSACA
jgi:hypothetical protein